MGTEVKFKNPHGDVVTASNLVDINDYRTRDGWTEIKASSPASAPPQTSGEAKPSDKK